MTSSSDRVAELISRSAEPLPNIDSPEFGDWFDRFGDARVVLLGFGTHTGTVAAAGDWDEPMRIKRVRPSLPESHERLSHDSGVDRFLLDLREGEADGRLIEALMEPRLERFIGVIYRPETERWSHYSEAILPKQFDAWIWFDENHGRHSTAGRTAAGPGRDVSVWALSALESARALPSFVQNGRISAQYQQLA